MPTALIVDDEPDANALLGMLVGLRGYRTASAFDGMGALGSAAADPPDVLLLDLMLPDLGGFEVCRKLRADRSTALVPIIFLSARLSARNEAESLRAGAVAFVPKPFRPDQVFEALERAKVWRRDLETPQADRSIPLDTRDESAYSRSIGILRCLLAARSPTEAEEAQGIVSAIDHLAESARAWGSGRGVEPVAEVSYRLDDEALRVSVRDLAGWFRAGRPPVDPSALRPDLFPETAPGLDGQAFVMARKFAPAMTS